MSCKDIGKWQGQDWQQLFSGAISNPQFPQGRKSCKSYGPMVSENRRKAQHPLDGVIMVSSSRADFNLFDMPICHSVASCTLTPCHLMLLFPSCVFPISARLSRSSVEK